MRASPASDLSATARRLLGSRQLNHLVRFDPVIELIRELPIEHRTLLDVGSGSVGIAPLLPCGWSTTSIDADFEDYGATPRGAADAPDKVLGDVRCLPFSDRAFGVVVAIDLLEHVAAEDRPQAVREICRVARSRAVVACPAGEPALAADRELASRLRAHRRAVPPWLDEHLKNGFPDAAEIVAAARPFGTPRMAGNESIAAHVRLMRAELRPPSGVALRLACKLLQALLTASRPRQRRIARRALKAIRGGDQPPTYRAVVVVDIRSGGEAQPDDHSRE